MTKKTRIAIVCVAVLLICLFTGCNKKKVEETTEMVETTVTETTEPEIPGVAKNILDESDFFDSAEGETTEETVTAEDDETDVTTPKQQNPNPTESTKNTEPKETEVTPPKEQDPDSTESTKNTEPKETEATTPTEQNPDPTEATTPTGDNSSGNEEAPQSKIETDYERYHSMSGAEQKKFMDSFGSIEAFFEWYNNAKTEYDALIEKIDPENPEIDMSGFTN